MLEPGSFVELRDGRILRVDTTVADPRSGSSTIVVGRVHVPRTQLPAALSALLPPPRLGTGSRELVESPDVRGALLCDVVRSCYALSWDSASRVPGGPAVWASVPCQYILAGALPPPPRPPAASPRVVARGRPSGARPVRMSGRAVAAEGPRAFYGAFELGGVLYGLNDFVLLDSGDAGPPLVARVRSIVEEEAPGGLPARQYVGVQWLVRPSEVASVPVACRPRELFASSDGDYSPAACVLRRCEVSLWPDDPEAASLWALSAPQGSERFFVSRWFDAVNHAITDAEPAVAVHPLSSGERFGFVGLQAAKEHEVLDLTSAPYANATLSAAALSSSLALVNATGRLASHRVLSLRLNPQAYAFDSTRVARFRKRLAGSDRVVSVEAVMAARIVARIEASAARGGDTGAEVSCHVVELFADNKGRGLYPMRHTFVDGQCPDEGNSSGGQQGSEQHQSQQPHQRNGTAKVEVLTYNIWNYNGPWEKRLPELAKRICDDRYDAVALQEVRYSAWDGEHTGTPQPLGRLQIDQIARACAAMGRHRQFVFEPGMTYQPSHVTREYETEGVAVVSKHHIESVSHTHLSHDLDDQEDVHQRVVLAARIRLPEPAPSFTLFVSHFSLSLAAQQRNAREALQMASRQEFDGPQVFTGDLNALPDSQAIRTLVATDGFEDAWANAPSKESPTPGGFTFSTLNESPSKRIDFVLYRGGLAPTSAVVGPAQCDISTGSKDQGRVCASDHLPLAVSFDLAPAESRPSDHEDRGDRVEL
eukprot:m51a1_g11076 hypothetical protein (765) ;mRNA; f:561804-565578